ncbi:MAG TPA: hypothetical protein VF767_11120 [Bryobacteraceae bacterium]
MGEFVLTISTVLSFLSTLFFWGGLVLIIVMLRKATKDLGELKRSVAALEATLMAMPRPASGDGAPSSTPASLHSIE